MAEISGVIAVVYMASLSLYFIRNKSTLVGELVDVVKELPFAPFKIVTELPHVSYLAV